MLQRRDSVATGPHIFVSFPFIYCLSSEKKNSDKNRDGKFWRRKYETKYIM